MSQHDQEQARTPELSRDTPMYVNKNAPPSNGLVSIGVPVRNGGQFLRYALDSIVSQEYTNIEIIISDNNSTDDTASIALELQGRDSRVIYHRQPRFLTALENFRFVLDEAKGEYFMWAAHDDTRSRDFVSTLYATMQSDPEPIVSFGDLCITDFLTHEGPITTYPFDTTRLGTFRRMRKTAHMCYHFYGLWRTNVLRKIPFHPCMWSPDRPIMIAAAILGTSKYVPGPIFNCRWLPKSDSQRAAYQDGIADFNKYSGMQNLLLATYKTSAAVGGTLIGILAMFFVAEPHIRHLPRFVLKKLRRMSLLQR